LLIQLLLSSSACLFTSTGANIVAKMNIMRNVKYCFESARKWGSSGASCGAAAARCVLLARGRKPSGLRHVDCLRWRRPDLLHVRLSAPDPKRSGRLPPTRSHKPRASALLPAFCDLLEGAETQCRRPSSSASFKLRAAMNDGLSCPTGPLRHQQCEGDE
jgi:hypothetical protein